MSAEGDDARLAALDAEVMAAHAAGDLVALVRLYRAGGEIVLARGDTDHGCFLLTQAYVYALDAGLPGAAEIRALLALHGRETVK